jgi:hypothetical protein
MTISGSSHCLTFPWSGEGNPGERRERSHVTDDPINLVQAAANAGINDRTAPRYAAPVGRVPDLLPGDARALSAEPVVAVRPGVRNVTRQWPAVHFAA